MITVDLRSRKQLYEQIIDCVKELILSDELKPDEKLPSVRSLAAELGINPNTIQKAYAELERQGIIVTLPGRGSVVTQQVGILIDRHRNELIDELERIIHSAMQTGMTEAEFDAMIDMAWEKYRSSHPKKEENQND